MGEGDATKPAKPLPHSGVGLSSFIIGLVALIAIIVPPVLITEPWREIWAFSQLVALMGFILVRIPTTYLFVLASLVGLVLGIFALFQRDKRKAFSAAGVGINSLILGSMTAWFVILAQAGPSDGWIGRG